MNERELFEAAYCESIAVPRDQTGQTFQQYFCNGEYRYTNAFLRTAWDVWQASANRQGYKLVPVDELLRKAQNIRALNTGEYASDEIEENICEIEAMIGAVDEST